VGALSSATLIFLLVLPSPASSPLAARFFEAEAEEEEEADAAEAEEEEEEADDGDLPASESFFCCSEPALASDAAFCKQTKRLSEKQGRGRSEQGAI
jgi:hypothetical protein